MVFCYAVRGRSSGQNVYWTPFWNRGTDLFWIGMRIVPPPPYFLRIFIKLQKSILKPKFYQKVLAEFALQNCYPQNFAIDLWCYLLKYKPGLWRRGRPAKRLRRRKIWGKNFDGKRSENRVKVCRFGAIFAGNSISVSINMIVDLVGGTRGQKGKRGANELCEKPTFERTTSATACTGAIRASTKW